MNNELTTFENLIVEFEKRFNHGHFPPTPEKLYHAAEYLLSLRGKRIRPVLCLMANELFTDLMEDAFHAAAAIELFHNFTLVHDDIMDQAPLRRGMPSVHVQFGESTALLAGDVMLVKAYDYLSKINKDFLRKILHLFNDTASKVCEGQQLDMEFEAIDEISLEDYVEMISLKTSVLLAGSLQMGAILGGASRGNQEFLYSFGKNLGIAFQIQDDYLDAFGNPEKLGKRRGGDIMANKKTFLLLQALQQCKGAQKEELEKWLKSKEESKIEPILEVYKSCGVDQWARELKQTYLNKALYDLEEIAVLSARKEALRKLASVLMDREQ